MKNKITDFISYICQKLNIATDNAFILEDIGKSLSQLNVIEFRAFLNENYNKEKYNFKTGIQKFDMLIEDFKKPLVESSNETIEKYCTKLINKLSEVNLSIYHQAETKAGFNMQEFLQKVTYDNFIVNKSPYFNEKEQTLINRVGGLPYSLNACNDFVYKMKLEKECRNLKNMNEKQLEHKDKTVLKKLEIGVKR